MIIPPPNLATVKNNLVKEGHNKILKSKFPEPMVVEPVDIFMKKYILVEHHWM